MIENDDYTEENSKFMVRDSDQTKSFIWTAYDGVVKFHQDINLFENPPYDVILGFKKYITEFYFQIKYIWQEFKKIKEKDIQKFESIIKKEIEHLTKQDYEDARNFCEEFMYKSGLKNIIFQKDDPGQSVKKNR